MNTATTAKRQGVIADREHIKHALHNLTLPGQVFEIRILDGMLPGDRMPVTLRGYFDREHIDELIKELSRLTAGSVYFTINPCKPDLLARAPYKLKRCGKGDNTADHDVLCRRFFYLDFDPVRSAGICATDEEKQMAQARAQTVREDLAELGWPEPFIGDSGNGEAMFYPVELSADDPEGLIDGCVNAISERYSDDQVSIDVTVDNAARIARVPGTTNMKGDEDAGDVCGRPWRPARLLEIPEHLVNVPIEKLREMAGTAKAEPTGNSKTHCKANGTVNGSKFDLADWIRQRNVPVDAPEPWRHKGGTGTRYVFPVCPFNSDHTDRSAVVMQFSDGPLVFRCHHNGCSSYDWHDLRDRYEPGWKDKHKSHNGKSQQPAPARNDLDDTPEPIPLSDPEPPGLPQGIFTGWLADKVLATAAHTETPAELSAAAALSILGVCAQGKISIMPEPGYFESTSIYFAAFLPSGQRKSAVLSTFLTPLIEWEQARAAELGPKIKLLVAERKTRELQIRKLREKAATTGDETLIKQAAELEANLPDVPRLPRLILQDVTPEHMGTMLSHHNERLGLFSDEGGAFDNFAGRYSANGSANLDLLLQAYTGTFVRVDRGRREPVVLHHPALTLCVTPQPDVAVGLASKPGFRGRGLLARFCYFLPPSNLGARRLVPRPINPQIEKVYAEYVHQLIDLPEPKAKGRNGPFVFTFDAQAYGVWKQFQRSIESMMAKGGRLESLTDIGGKLPGMCARIAGLLHLADYGAAAVDNCEIRVEVMQRAVKLCECLLEHAMAVFGLMGADQTVQAARRLWAEIAKAGKLSITAREAWLPTRKIYPKMADVAGGFRVLVERAYLLESDEDTQRGPGRPSRRYTVNPKAMKVFAHSAPCAPGGNHG